MDRLRLCCSCILLLTSALSSTPSNAFQPIITSLSRRIATLKMTATATRREAPLTQSSYGARLHPSSSIQSTDVATLPRPGTSSPSSIQFHADGDEVWITYLLPSDPTSLTRQLYATQVLPQSQSDVKAQTIELFQHCSSKGAGGTENDFSLEEKLRRERARMMSTGVTSYSWASDDDDDAALNSSNSPTNRKMIIPFGGALWLLEGNSLKAGGCFSEPVKIAETNKSDSSSNSNSNNVLPPGAPLLDAKISSNGEVVGFVCGDEVYTISTNNPTNGIHIPRQITTGARGIKGKTNGVADYLAQEELDRADGYWLSPHGTMVAYEEVDESHVPAYRIVHQGEDRGLSSSTSFVKGQSQEEVETGARVTYEETRYPFAGGRNPIVKFGVADATGKSDVRWFDDLAKPFGDDFYLAKVEWLPADNSEANDSTKLVVQLLNRRQNELALLLLDCESGDVTTLHTETAKEAQWVNLNGSFRPLSTPTTDSDKSSFRFLWASERDGYRHLYILESSLTIDGGSNKTEAKVVRRLTGPGEFIVEEVVGIDEENGVVYYMGTVPNRWLERHLFRVSMNKDEEPTCITGFAPGQHHVKLNVKAGLFVDTVSSTTHAPVVTVRKLPPFNEETPSETTVNAIHELHNAGTDDPRVAKFGSALKIPNFHTFPSTDGTVTLQAALYTPDENIHGKGPWPLVVATYGGPHVQYVQNTWGMMTVDMRSQFLVQNGFAVIKVDNRGSNRRGLGFEVPVYGNMGELEIDDQVAGVNWAVENGIADRERVAISGWSYGGYMALKGLTDRPDVFQAAVAGAPVTDWALYDSAYTERYMGLPQENPEGYAKASALAKVKDIQGSLLLCHGLLDENVLFRQSAVLANELIEHKKAFDLALFPSERHGPRRPQDRAFLEERILAFLQRSLGV